MPQIVCKQCGKETPQRPSAENKKFCSEKCRNKWHSERRAAALRLLAEKEHDE